MSTDAAATLGRHRPLTDPAAGNYPMISRSQTRGREASMMSGSSTN